MKYLVYCVSLILVSILVSCEKQDELSQNPNEQNVVTKTLDSHYCVMPCTLPDGSCGGECAIGQSDCCLNASDCIGGEGVSAALSNHYTEEELNSFPSDYEFPQDVVDDLKEVSELPIK